MSSAATTTTKRPSLNDTVSDNFSLKKPKPHNHTLLNPSPPQQQQQQPPQQQQQQPPFSDHDDFSDILFDDDDDELSKLLDTPTCHFLNPYTCPPPPPSCPVKFVSYPYVSPPVEYSTSYVTINGNDETCGSSFSDADTSLMASFDTATVDIADPLSLWGVASAAAHGGSHSDWNDFLWGDPDNVRF